MDTSSSACKFLYLSLLCSTLIICSTGVSLSHVKYIKHHQIEKEEQTSLKFRTVMHDSFNFPATTTPAATVTVPPDTSTPTVITVPSSAPVPITPTPPAATVPPTTPATNPVTTPTPNNPVVTNPITTPVVVAPPGGAATTAPAPPAATTAPAPPAATTAPAAPGQSWCVAKSGAPEKSLQSALDYACGIGKADCSGIQQGATCYNPNTLQNHASVAFNNYYQKNPSPTSCDFGSTAMITTANPSTGSCIYASSSSSSSPTTASPTTSTPPTNPTSILTPPTNPASTPTPPTPVPTTSSSTGAAPVGSFGAPPSLLNGSFPGFGGDSTGFGQGPTSANMTSSVSRTSNLQHFIRSILVVTFITGGIVLGI